MRGYEHDTIYTGYDKAKERRFYFFVLHFQVTVRQY